MLTQKLFFCIIAVSLVSGCASTPLKTSSQTPNESSQSKHVDPPKTIAVQKLPTTFLYEVSKGGDRSFLFGTVHFGVAVSELPDSVLTAFENARLYVGEFDFRNATALSEFDGRRHAKDLRDVLSEKDLDLLIQRLQSKYPKADKEMLQTLVKFSTATDIYPLTQVDLSMVQAAAKPNSNVASESLQSLDVQLLDLAILRGKTVSFLDSPRMAGEALQCIRYTDDKYLQQLRKFIEGKPSAVSTGDQQQKTLGVMQETVNAYRSGSAARIRKAGQNLTPKLHKCLLESRNEEWVKSLERSFDTFSNVFVAVGVLHLEDDRDSLTRRLEKDGYTVKRVQ